jgi:hypothetical protein
MPTLDATIGGAAANSYASLADGQAYVDTLVPSTLGDAWNDGGEEEQVKALIMATRLLDTWFEWYGFVAASDQALLWPRSGVVGPNGYEVATDEIPQRIIEATVELARQLLAGDRIGDSDLETNKLKSLKAGPVELEFGGSVYAKPIPDAVMVMAGFFGTMRARGGVGTVHLYRA